MSAHTLGPWRVQDGTTRVVATDARHTVICDVAGAPSNPQAQAEARLIAAAPDLLEALEDILECTRLPRDVAERASAAIDKARGAK